MQMTVKSLKVAFIGIHQGLFRQITRIPASDADTIAASVINGPG